jgi:NAD(P)-dependent dehydrogenase (short-subunit alcohol dehydrogenase family)
MGKNAQSEVAEVMQQAKNSPLAGNLSVVTGAGSGIGAGIARRLARLGSQVVLCGRRKEPLEALRAELSSSHLRAEAVVCDVTDLQAVERLAEFVQKNFGRCDVLVNNAGVGDFTRPLLQLPPGRWDLILNTNLRGAYYCIRALAPMMISGGGGHIINISSLAGKNALPNGAAYAASKWGLNGLSYSVAEELRSQKVRVSVICPGSTHSDLSPHEGRDASRMLQPDDVAHVVEMLVTQAPQAFASEIILRPTQKP